MTDYRKLKQEIRERMARTGERYVVARRRVLELCENNQSGRKGDQRAPGA